MDFGNADSWGAAIYFWIFPFVLLAAAASWLGDLLVFQLFKRRLSHVLDRWRWGLGFHAAVHAAIAKAGRSSTYGAISGRRFIPGARLATTAAAGIANVSTRGFSLCAALGGTLWAVWSVGLGYATGSATKLPFWASSLIGVALGLVIGAAVGVVVTRRRGNRSPVVEPDSAVADPDEELDF